MAIPGAFRRRFALIEVDGSLRGVPVESEGADAHRALGRFPGLTIERDALVVSADPAGRRSQSAIARAIRRLRGEVLLPDRHAFHSAPGFASLLQPGDLLDIELDPMARSSLRFWRAGTLALAVGNLHGSFAAAGVRVTIAAPPDEAAAVVVRAGDEVVDWRPATIARSGRSSCAQSAAHGPGSADDTTTFASSTPRGCADVGDALGYDFGKVGG